MARPATKYRAGTDDALSPTVLPGAGVAGRGGALQRELGVIRVGGAEATDAPARLRELLDEFETRSRGFSVIMLLLGPLSVGGGENAEVVILVSAHPVKVAAELPRLRRVL